MKLIALCDGHGMETAGKRTPILPDGSVMLENEFNRRVVVLLDNHLNRCGFRSLLVAPTDMDTPLKERTNIANVAKADLYISVHANAIGTGVLNGVRGIETFHYTRASEASRKVAGIIHRHLISGTKLPDRGVKAADFHVLRETNMPAVLVECGFMTNLGDAELLKSEVYREECAEEIARGVCEYFDIPFVRESSDLPKIDERIKVVIYGATINDGYIIDGRSYVPLRSAGYALNMEANWNPETKTASLS